MRSINRYTYLYLITLNRLIANRISQTPKQSERTSQWKVRPIFVTRIG